MKREPGFLDVRPEPAFLSGHRPDAATIPLEELGLRVHELPASSEPIIVLDDDPERVARAAAFLRERGHAVETGSATGVTRASGAGAAGAKAAGAGPHATGGTGAPHDPGPVLVPGPAQVRLWRPAPFLERALNRVRPALPPRPRSLDVACGSGRDAVFLALEGFAAEAIDVLPDALDRARDLARRSGGSLATEARDVEADPTLPLARYDLVTVFRFLWRPLFPALAAALAPGGFLVYETFHERTRETGRSPRSEAHLLRTGELESLCAAQGLEPWIVEDAVAIPGDGRFSSRIVARRAVAG